VGLRRVTVATPTAAEIDEALAAWRLSDVRVTPVSSGHINHTLLVEGPDGRLVLQRLSPIFGPEVHLDIAAITAALDEAGLCTPRLVATRVGQLWTTTPDGRVWRLFTFIDGETLLRADSPARCRAAAQLLGRFHRALWTCEHEFQHHRVGVHETRRHLAKLERLLAERRDHRLAAQIAPLGEAILHAARRLTLPEGIATRVVHGDPKISNVVFDPGGDALCLIDLDTLARMPLAVELGDALRSWCAPQGEEVDGPIALDYLESALLGYADAIGELPERAELDAIPATVEVIAVELAARFCSDAVEESYFGWDAARFPSASEHNLVRARAQLSLARSVRDRLPALERLIQQLWPGRR
jgi:Ser/Thr protein kinase RdoA (MazF antagonist)